MAEEFQAGICGGTWWNIPSRSVFAGGMLSASPCSTGIGDVAVVAGGCYGGWIANNNDLLVMDMKQGIKSCDHHQDSNNNNNNSVSGDGSVVFQKAQQTDSDSGSSSSNVFMDSTLQMMGLGLSSSSTSSSDWNPGLIGSGGDGNYNSILAEDHMNSNRLSSYRQETATAMDSSLKSFTRTCEDSSITTATTAAAAAFKPINHQDPTSEGLSSSGFPINSSPTASFGYPASTTLIQSLFEPDHHLQQQQSLFNNRSMSYNINMPMAAISSCGTNSNEIPPAASNWPNKFASFLKPSLHFSNNAPFWNATATTGLNDIRASFLPSSQSKFLAPTLEEKPNCPSLTKKHNIEEGGDTEPVAKKAGNEASFKRPRIETPSPLPTFKVRKEKLGDRITALQQLVSPFGKTDTASVLHEAIEYIKFLHDQVSVLSTAYMKNNGGPIQHHQQSPDKLKDSEGAKQDLRSRGLCLVPISSTFPVANETTADIWTSTFGGTFR